MSLSTKNGNALGLLAAVAGLTSDKSSMGTIGQSTSMPLIQLSNDANRLMVKAGSEKSASSNETGTTGTASVDTAMSVRSSLSSSSSLNPHVELYSEDDVIIRRSANKPGTPRISNLSPPRVRPFPIVLMNTLLNPEHQSTIGFRPGCNKSFEIYNPKGLQNSVLPSEFQLDRIDSFLKRVSAQSKSTLPCKNSASCTLQS